MRKKIVAGNWKMNGQLQQVTQLTNQLRELLNFPSPAEVVLFPPAIYIPVVNDLLAGSKIEIGAQNIFPKASGAFTGELSPLMLKDFNCHYVLVGHSERRHDFHEDENFVAQKFHHVKDHGMIPILCVGETLIEREKGKTQQVITNLVTQELFDGVHTNYWNYYKGLWQGGNATIKHGHDVDSEFMKTITDFYASCETCYLQLGQAVEAPQAACDVNQSMLTIIEHCTKLSGQKLADRAERRLLSATEDYATVLELLAAVNYELHQLQLKMAEEKENYSSKNRARPVLNDISGTLNSNNVNTALASQIDICTAKISTSPKKCSLSLQNRYQTLQETVRQITNCLSIISANKSMNSQKCPTVEPIKELVQEKLFDGVHTNYWKYYTGMFQGGNATIKHGHDVGGAFMKTITNFYASCETCYMQLGQAVDAQQAARDVNQSMLAIIDHCTKLSELLEKELKQAVNSVYWTNKLGL